MEDQKANLKELAQARVEVKRELRKQLRKISGKTICISLIANDLEPTNYLIENLERIADRHDQTGLIFNYNSNLSTPHFQNRDEISELINWLLNEEGYPLIKKWDDTVSILNGAK